MCTPPLPPVFPPPTPTVSSASSAQTCSLRARATPIAAGPPSWLPSHPSAVTAIHWVSPTLFPVRLCIWPWGQQKLSPSSALKPRLLVPWLRFPGPWGHGGAWERPSALCWQRRVPLSCPLPHLGAIGCPATRLSTGPHRLRCAGRRWDGRISKSSCRILSAFGMHCNLSRPLGVRCRVSVPLKRPLEPVCSPPRPPLPPHWLPRFARSGSDLPPLPWPPCSAGSELSGEKLPEVADVRKGPVSPGLGLHRLRAPGVYYKQLKGQSVR